VDVAGGPHAAALREKQDDLLERTREHALFEEDERDAGEAPSKVAQHLVGVLGVEDLGGEHLGHPAAGPQERGPVDDERRPRGREPRQAHARAFGEVVSARPVRIETLVAHVRRIPDDGVDQGQLETGREAQEVAVNQPRWRVADARVVQPGGIGLLVKLAAEDLLSGVRLACAETAKVLVGGTKEHKAAEARIEHSVARFADGPADELLGHRRRRVEGAELLPAGGGKSWSGVVHARIVRGASDPPALPVGGAVRIGPCAERPAASRTKMIPV